MSAPTTTKSLTMQDFFSTTLSGAIAASDTVIPLNAVPTGTEGFLVIDQDNSSKEIIYYNTKGGSSVTVPNVATGRGQGGTTAVSHLSGATVKMNVVSQYLTEIQNGNALGDNAIGARSLATSAITLGYAQITSSFSTASTSAVQVTGLTVTVTIPAGGRRVKITAYTNSLSQNTGGNYTVLNIWDGTVGSGTQLCEYAVFNPSAQGSGATAIAVVSPSAGSKTYNVSLKALPSGTGTLNGSSISPAFILVEAI